MMSFRRRPDRHGMIPSSLPARTIQLANEAKCCSTLGAKQCTLWMACRHSKGQWLLGREPAKSGPKNLEASGYLQPEREDRPAFGPVLDGDAAAVRLGDAGHDGKAEAAAVGLRPVAPPEPREDRPPVGLRNARPVVDDANAALGRNLDLDRHAQRRVADGVLDQV